MWSASSEHSRPVAWAVAPEDSRRMGWKRRLIDLAVAGGFAASGCAFQCGIPKCNANPDPCCFDATSNECLAREACVANPTLCCCTQLDPGHSIYGCAHLDGGYGFG